MYPLQLYTLFNAYLLTYHSFPYHEEDPVPLAFRVRILRQRD
jgi:hypothetical protein